MKTAKLLGGCLIAVVTILSCRKVNNNSNQLNDADNKFILLAGMNNRSEAETAKIAVSKTTDSIVWAFAQQILSVHTNAQSDLKTMGTVVGFTVKDTIDAAHAATISQLDTLTGRTFDTTYIHTQLAEHQGMINFYTDEIKNGRQINVRSYASAIFQNIQIDYQRADSIAAAF